MKINAAKSHSFDVNISSTARANSRQRKKPRDRNIINDAAAAGIEVDPPLRGAVGTSSQGTKSTKSTLMAEGGGTTPKRRGKNRIIVQLETGQKAAVEGLCDEDSNRYIRCRIGKRTCLTPLAHWHGNGAAASAALRDAGLVLVKGFADVHDAVSQIRRFRREPIVVRYGWSGLSFAQSNGVVIFPKSGPEPSTMLPPDSGLLAKGGTLAGWLQNVAAPLTNQTLPVFAMMTMHAGPLLRFTDRTDNFGFELSGDAGVGKSTLQILAASAAGPVVGNGDTTYWRSLNATPNALETTMQHFNDMTLMLEEAALLPGSAKREIRGAITGEIAFRLSAGQVKHRLGEATGPRSRFVYMLSTNRPVSSLLGSAHGAEADAVADRLMTLTISSDRQHGIFDHCPPAYANTGEYATALRQGAAEHYGHALPKFLRYLVARNAANPGKLRDRIAALIEAFVNECGADKSNGSQLRVAKAFGHVYAAGILAKAAGTLPKSYKCMVAAKAAYDVHRSHGRGPASFMEQLAAVIRDRRTIDLTGVDLASLSTEQLATARALLFTGRSKQRELLIPVAMINTVFPGWNGLRRDTEVLMYLKQSGDRPSVFRHVGPGGQRIAVYCFDVTELVA